MKCMIVSAVVEEWFDVHYYTVDVYYNARDTLNNVSYEYIPVGVLMALFVALVARGGVDALSVVSDGKSSENWTRNKMVLFKWKLSHYPSSTAALLL